MLTVLARRHVVPPTSRRLGRSTGSPVREASRKARAPPRGHSLAPPPPSPSATNTLFGSRPPLDQLSSGLSVNGTIGLLLGGITYMQFRARLAKRDRDERWVVTAVTSPHHIISGRVHTLLTSTFLPVSISEFVLATGAIWWFGREVARTLGPARFLGVYLACGTASSLVAVAYQLRASETQHDRIDAGNHRPVAVEVADTTKSGFYLVCGPSGAVNAMVVLYATLVAPASLALAVYFVLFTLEKGFLSSQPISAGRDVGHVSGIFWGGLAAARFHARLRRIR